MWVTLLFAIKNTPLLHRKKIIMIASVNKKDDDGEHNSIILNINAITVFILFIKIPVKGLKKIDSYILFSRHLSKLS